MMKKFLWILMLSSVIMMGTIIGVSNAQAEKSQLESIAKDVAFLKRKYKRLKP